jgi:hypothetical protein
MEQGASVVGTAQGVGKHGRVRGGQLDSMIHIERLFP